MTELKKSLKVNHTMCHFHHLGDQLAGLSITIASLLMSPALSGLQRVCCSTDNFAFKFQFGFWSVLKGMARSDHSGISD